ncbi:MAG: hypothetical protein HC830_03640, partial [Bacteroidetes bacterium]|nr:hypothetical protein [Bacteroidota bacterium]
MNKIKSFAIFLFLILLFSPGNSQLPGFSNFDKSTVRGTPGFYRVAKTIQGAMVVSRNQRTQLFYRGICAVNRAGTAGGRRANPGPYAVTIDKKYNYQESPDAFIKACNDKLLQLNFNAWGAWATEEFFNKDMPFTEIIEFFKEGPFLPSVNQKQGLPDIFHPDWLVAADKKTRALCSPLRDSKLLIGYFTDNEIGFGKTDDFGLDLGFTAGQFDFALLRLVLGMNTGEPAFEYAWNFLLNRYHNSFQELSDAWKVPIGSKDDIRRLNETKAAIPGKSFSDDAQAFVELYAHRYFELTSKLIRRYDPNHLILGCRFGSPPPTYVLDAIKPWTDVISGNNYQPILYERYDTVYEYTGCPILIGEFSWNTDLYKKVPLPFEADNPLTMKNRMFERGKNTLLRTAVHPGIVGYTWYRWVQGTCTDEKFYDGIVNYGDSLEMHAAELKDLNLALEKARINAAIHRWENMPAVNGEFTLFFEFLRPGWNHFLRFTMVEGKPSGTLNGWKMSGKVLKYANKKDVYSIKIE